MTAVALPDRAAYRRVFLEEQAREYPTVDAFEARCGYALDRKKLEAAACVLACPVKANPPNWQHGRVLYAATRQYLDGRPVEDLHCLDLGTAKGFSALCLRWAVDDAWAARPRPPFTVGRVTSVDVIDPRQRVRRNTVAECDLVQTLPEILVPWPEAQRIQFLHTTGLAWLSARTDRVHVAFVDGKHTEVVYQEGRVLASRQQPTDLAIFDDVQIAAVGRAVQGLESFYHFQTLTVRDHRQYAIGVRR
jgi:hypothetical protein